MSPKRRWAAVASRLPMRPMPDPHGASAMAEVYGIRFAPRSSPGGTAATRIPGWVRTHCREDHRRCCRRGSRRPNGLGRRLESRSVRSGVGRLDGRAAVRARVGRTSGLHVLTATSPHQIEDRLSIDHMAVPKSWVVSATHRHRAFVGETRISDHDAYVVEVAGASTPTWAVGTCLSPSRNGAPRSPEAAATPWSLPSSGRSREVRLRVPSHERFHSAVVDESLVEQPLDGPVLGSSIAPGIPR